MYLEKIESILTQLKDKSAVSDQIENDIAHICDYFSSIVFSETRAIIISNENDDPNKKEYAELECAHHESALKAAAELNDIFISHGFAPLFEGHINDLCELQIFARDISIELFRHRRGSGATTVKYAGGEIRFVPIDEIE